MSDSGQSMRNGKRRAVRFAATVLIVVAGLGAGWLAGKVLNRSLGSARPASDISATANANSQAQTQPEASSPLAAGSNKSQPRTEKQPSANSSSKGSQDKPEPPDKTEPPKKEPPRDDMNPPEIRDPEEATRKINRKALKKMMKEINKGNGSKQPDRNNNENQNRHD